MRRSIGPCVDPVLNSGADIIGSVPAWFIGMWGEWYYTDNFGDLGQ